MACCAIVQYTMYKLDLNHCRQRAPKEEGCKANFAFRS